MKKIKIFTICGLIVFSLLIYPFLASASGIVSNTLIVNNARKGQSDLESFTVINSSDKTVNFDLSAEGNIASWTTFYATDNLQTPITTIPVPASSRLSVNVKFNIPGAARNGEYRGSLVATTRLSSENYTENNLAIVKQKFNREVRITVSDDMTFLFNTTFIPLNYALAKNEPLKVRVIHDNKGNVDIKPSVKLLVSKDGNEVFKALFPFPDGENPIMPSESREISNQIDWNTKGYDAGKYDITLTAVENDTIFKTETFPIYIGYDKNLEMFNAAISKVMSGRLPFVLAAIGIIVLAVIFGVAISKKAKKASQCL